MDIGHPQSSGDYKQLVSHKTTKLSWSSRQYIIYFYTYLNISDVDDDDDSDDISVGRDCVGLGSMQQQTQMDSCYLL